eukprot:scaffold8055_cov115-Skeletonema_dohrnii-CCMP3373.AAC.2
MTEYAIGFAVSTLMFIAACVYWLSKRSRDYKPSEKQQHIVEPKKESQVINSSESSSESSSEQKLRNVFSVKQKPPVSSNGGAKAAGSDRPFESSYYFAHNKHSTGGGYKDGLRAEDYVMNGPKLLSKGGVRVEDEKSNSSVVDEADSAEERSSASSQSVSEKKQTPQMQASTPITRYLWDDGEGNTAKIHIDTLPVSSTKSINWEDASVSSVEARLIGDNNEGLFIGITYNIKDDTSNLTKKCHLHVARMYGNADEVKAMVKKRKLLVKITKKPRQLSNRHSNNGGVWGKLTGGQDGAKTVPVAWPQLSSSSSRLGGSEIDEDMFKKSS